MVVRKTRRSDRARVLRAQAGAAPVVQSPAPAWAVLACYAPPAEAAVADLVKRARTFLKWIERLADARRTWTPEDVHDIRVASRRLSAVLALFGPLLPGRVRRLRDAVRAVLKAFGPARDAEVVAHTLEALPRTVRTAPLTAHIAALRAQRDELTRAAVRDARKAVTARDRETLAELAKRPPRALRDAAVLAALSVFLTGRMRPAAERFAVQFGEAGKHTSTEALHELRIALKRARYTLEIGGAPSDTAAESALREFAAMQEHLGALNDRAVALASVAQLGLPRAEEALRRQCARLLAGLHKFGLEAPGGAAPGPPLKGRMR